MNQLLARQVRVPQRHSRRCAFWLLLSASLALTGPTASQAKTTPQTVPERTNYQATSRAADVERFINACIDLAHGNRLTVRVAGKSHGGHGQLLVQVQLPERPEPPPLRALIIGNIHGGEVEGKEALQQLVREFALGEHEALLQHCEVWCVPIYNVDGNEAMAVGNRRGQNGPDEVGKRPNGQGLDLNRDFVKLDAPETRTLVALFHEFDPHLFMDLHTTNGSHHGYHLTYSPSLSPNVDRDVDRLGRQLLRAARADMQQRGFASFDYGNFRTRDWDGGGAPISPDGRGWFTYDHRARYGTNYFGLRNRISVLSEAYSYADFQTRIAATRAFVLSVLDQLVTQRGNVLATTAAADQRLATGRPVWFGTDTTFGLVEPLPVAIGAVDRVDDEQGNPKRFVRRDESHDEELPVVRRFCARTQSRMPLGWAIRTPSTDVLDRLRRHGIEFEAAQLGATHRVQRFAVDQRRKPKRPFQGHQELELIGHWLAPEQIALPGGTVIVSAHQRLARIAATLLEPTSEDSLSTWNFFESTTDSEYPVMRLLNP